MKFQDRRNFLVVLNPMECHAQLISLYLHVQLTATYNTSTDFNDREVRKNKEVSDTRLRVYRDT